ncbi:hypothetical protein DPMN_000946 [Dreissena polymorpha]|uniref:Uncharacterized protein n=1 Tax=Dreissena polymorpha TaxID=45954 RepID=A0A9D4MJ50_DREPO|nr:hypothetical protein DPMN_000946 [Dreissena polymorpha]
MMGTFVINSVISCTQDSSRLIFIRISLRHQTITIVQVFATTSQDEDETHGHEEGILIVKGDWKANVEQRMRPTIEVRDFRPGILQTDMDTGSVYFILSQQLPISSINKANTRTFNGAIIVGKFEAYNILDNNIDATTTTSMKSCCHRPKKFLGK